MRRQLYLIIVLLLSAALLTTSTTVLRIDNENRAITESDQLTAKYIQGVTQASSTIDMQSELKGALTFFRTVTQGSVATDYLLSVRAPIATHYCRGKDVEILWDASPNFERFIISLFDRGYYVEIAKISVPVEALQKKVYRGSYLWQAGTLASGVVQETQNSAHFIEIKGQGGLNSWGEAREFSETFFLQNCDG